MPSAVTMGFRDGVLLDGVLSTMKACADEQDVVIQSAFAADCLWLDDVIAATLNEINSGASPALSPTLGEKSQGLVIPPNAGQPRNVGVTAKRKQSGAVRNSMVAKTARERYGGLLAYGDEENVHDNDPVGHHEVGLARNDDNQPTRKKRSLDVTSPPQPLAPSTQQNKPDTKQPKNEAKKRQPKLMQRQAAMASQTTHMAMIPPSAHVDETLNLTNDNAAPMPVPRHSVQHRQHLDFDPDLSSIRGSPLDSGDDEISESEGESSTCQSPIIPMAIDRQPKMASPPHPPATTMPEKEDTTEKPEDHEVSPLVPATADRDKPKHDTAVIPRLSIRSVRRSISWQEVRQTKAKTRRLSNSSDMRPADISPMVDEQGKLSSAAVQKILESQKKPVAPRSPIHLPAGASSVVAKLTGRKFKLFKNTGSIYGDKSRKATGPATAEEGGEDFVDPTAVGYRASIDIPTRKSTRGSIDLLPWKKGSKAAAIPAQAAGRKMTQHEAATSGAPTTPIGVDAPTGDAPAEHVSDDALDPVMSGQLEVERSAKEAPSAPQLDAIKKLHDFRNQVFPITSSPNNTAPEAGKQQAVASGPKIEIQTREARPRPDSTSFKTPTPKSHTALDPSSAATVSLLPPKVAAATTKVAASGAEQQKSDPRILPGPYTPCAADSTLDSTCTNSPDGRAGSATKLADFTPVPLLAKAEAGPEPQANLVPSNLVTSTDMASIFTIAPRMGSKDASQVTEETDNAEDKATANGRAAEERIRALERQRKATAKAKQDEVDAKRQKHLEKRKKLDEEDERRRAELIRKEKEREERVKQALQRDRIQKEQKRKEQEQRYIDRANRLNELRGAGGTTTATAAGGRPVGATRQAHHPAVGGMMSPDGGGGASGGLAAGVKNAECYDMTSEKVRIMCDDYDSDEDNRRRRKKKIPDWASGNGLTECLRNQQGMDPDRLFKGVGGSDDGTMNLVQVFKEAPEKPRYRKRTSSANWTADRLTGVEELNYKKAIGLL